ncbi:MAG TPA: hypothetical protein VFC19_11540 [Candidatus Limnocylindrales bacterium]|nr:hypothetical protein [Candidatus Limnocylindrales bacterium]
MKIASWLRVSVVAVMVWGATTSAPAFSATSGTPSDLCARVTHAASFSGESLVNAIAVALAESGCNPLASHVNNFNSFNSFLDGVGVAVCTSSVDRGLFQINTCAHPDVSNECAYDAQCNADVAYNISARGTDWSAWAVYRTGAYRTYLDEARAAVERLNIDYQPRCRPVTGDWDGNGSVTMGLACIQDGTLELRWSLINTNSGGSPSIIGHYGSRRCVPVTGDWDGDRRTSIGVACRTADGRISWSLSNGYAGSQSYQFEYGSANCWPVTGDWNGDRRTSVGVACRTHGSIEITWSLINSLGGGSPSYPPFGYGSTACRPVTGDWDGDGDTNVGIACPSGGEIQWSLINTQGGSPSYPTFGFGSANGCWPVTGDWNGNRTTTIGIACAGDEMTWGLMNVHAGGTPQISTGYGSGRSYLFTDGWHGPDWPLWPNPY